MPTVVGFVESGCPFPVGFGGFFQTDPNTIYSGTTWEQKKDVFILASGTAYPAGSTGGEAEHTLTEVELPKLNGGIDHMIRYAGRGNSESGIISAKSMGLRFPSSTDENCSNWNIDISFGGSQPHNNMPPYFAMPFWIRTA